MSKSAFTLATTSLALVFALATVADAQQAVPRGGGGGGGSSSGGTAVPRGGDGGSSGGGGGSMGAPSSGGGSMGARGGSGFSGWSGDSGRARRSATDGIGFERAVPAGSRPRGDQPTQGFAVPRGSVVPPGGGGTTVIYYPDYSYGYWGYGGYPYGYGYGYGYGYPYLGFWPTWGSFGLGYYYPYDSYGYGYGYGSGYGSRGAYRTYDYGSVRLKVKPREAEVLVDGYYAGQVDDFDGVFQRLELEPGPHRIEVKANGFEPMVFEVRVLPSRTLTYEGQLEPAGAAPEIKK